MPKIFISYRRDDNAYAAQGIYSALRDHFGPESIVFDVDTIPLGTDFRKYLNDEVSKCGVLLAVIGDQWTKILNDRIDEPNDFVRIEIQAALKRGIPVVPVLLGKASMPNEKNLPPELAELAWKQATEVRAGKDLDSHIKRLVSGLEELLSKPRKSGPRHKLPGSPKPGPIASGLGRHRPPPSTKAPKAETLTTTEYERLLEMRYGNK